MAYYKNKKLFWLLIILALLLALLWYQNRLASKPLQQAASIGDQKISVEVVQTPWQQYRGLSFRKSLRPENGMLFLFPDKQVRNFVMREMNFPLDIIFIKDNKIQSIAANLEPEGALPQKVYSSSGPVDAVLELNGGYCARHNIKIGDRVSW